MKKRFQDHIVVITGASSGIGRASAIAFASEGAVTVLVSRNEEKLQEVASQITQQGGNAIVFPADVSDRSQVRDMIHKVVDKFGKIDVLFNNAGTSFVGPIGGKSFIEDTVKMINVDFLGTVYSVTEVLPIMKEQGSGHIVNMSSVVGKKAFPKFGGYSSVMHAISGFTDSLRQELAGAPISVSIVHPGLTQTALLETVEPEDMPPPFRFMTPISPELVAARLVEGVYRRKRKIVVPAQPKFLLFLDAISTGLGNWFVRLLSNRHVTRVLGIYRGRAYHDVVAMPGK